MSENPDQRMNRLLSAQENKRQPKRFYESATVRAHETGGFAVALDQAIIKTPSKLPLVMAHKKLALAVAEEWQSQGDTIDITGMMLTKLANTTLDRVTPERSRIIAEITAFAGSDLLCYRADTPPGLVERQAQNWDPLLHWLGEYIDAHLVVVSGVMHHQQPESALAAITKYLESLNDFQITALHNLSSLTGSAIIAMALHNGAIEPEAAWLAAHIEEDWTIEHWGSDEEAMQVRANYRIDYNRTLEFLTLVKDGAKGG